jgi:hypothetical protein
MAMKQLYQNDPRWKDTLLGHGKSETIGEFGCLLTSMAMVVNHFGGDETVASFNEKMRNGNGFANQWIRPAMISAVHPGVKYEKRVECSNQSAPMDEIDAALEAGSLVVVMLDGSPRPGVQGHWVVLHEKQGDDYLIWDPWHSEGAPDTLKERYGHGAPAEIIEDVIWYSGPQVEAKDQAKREPAPKPKPAPPAAPSKPTKPTGKPAAAADESFIVQPLVDGLKMRRQPEIVSGNIIKELKRSARLTPVEPVSSAQAKLGEHGQWMHVRDDEGDEGHVAAWYVTPLHDPVLGVRKEGAGDEDTTTKLAVKTTTEDVAFRKQPQISDATLIERVPLRTVFEVVEPGNPAQRIGVHGEWLKVKASDGTVGYVAAWYVEKA